jgi:hypothetical protein
MTHVSQLTLYWRPELFYVKPQIEKDSKLSVNLSEVYIPSNPLLRLIDHVSKQHFLFSTPFNELGDGNSLIDEK